MKKVLIPTKLDTFAAKLLRQNGFEVVQDADRELSVLVSENSDAAVLIVRSEKITADIIDVLPQLKLVFRALIGFFTESMTAVGSNPQWSVQWVQRGSLPTPYLDQSVFLIRS